MKIVRPLVIVLGSAMWCMTLCAQPAVTVQVSADTVYPGEIITVTYSVENGQGRLNLPDMTGLPVISGPNTSSSFLYQGGTVRSTQSYSFQLVAQEEGELLIPAATYTERDHVQDIGALVIVVTSEGKPAGQSKQKSKPSSPASTTREKRKF